MVHPNLSHPSTLSDPELESNPTCYFIEVVGPWGDWICHLCTLVLPDMWKQSCLALFFVQKDKRWLLNQAQVQSSRLLKFQKSTWCDMTKKRPLWSVDSCFLFEGQFIHWGETQELPVCVWQRMAKTKAALLPPVQNRDWAISFLGGGKGHQRQCIFLPLDSQFKLVM